jgi:predicted site-specific integrase-resolvase
MAPDAGGERMLKPDEVAAIFRVNVDAVARWADNGQIEFHRTPSGRRLYPESAVRAVLNGAVQ